MGEKRRVGELYALISPLVRNLEIGLHLVRPLGHPVDEQGPESFVDAQTEEGNLPIRVLL